MLRPLLSLLRQFIFWLLFFAFSRMVFLLFYSRLFRIEQAPANEIFGIFWHALKLDVSTASYLLILPFILLLIQYIFRLGWMDVCIKGYHILLILVYSLICSAELGVYAEWKSKLDYKALYYLNHPEEIADSAKTGNMILLTVILILQSGLGIWFYQKMIHLRFSKPKRTVFAALVAFIAGVPLLFLGIRGGLQAIPINQAEAYFSERPIVNHCAVNSAYNLYQSYIESRAILTTNPFQFYPTEEAGKVVSELQHVVKDTSLSILKTTRPNIVLIILESWSADLIESLGGKPGITPAFGALEKTGILFTDLYSSGNRSQQGMASIFGGFPSIPVTAITHHYNKFTKLPSLNRELEKAGYHSSYYYGGQLIYGGLRAYILDNKFDKIIEGKDIDPSIPRGKLGVHDEFVLQKQLSDLNREKEPFFSALFTLSSHSPYDQPVQNVLKWGGNEEQFINSAYYTDRCLKDYFTEARKQPWFTNTLFILVADHSHNTYRNWGVNQPEYRKIPMLLYGEAIKEEWRGQKVDRISSQTDIAVTLLKQLKISSDAFPWSRNLFNPYTKEFAYYEINIGCGWICPEGNFVYDKSSGRFLEMKLPDKIKEIRIREGKSYLQCVFQQFMDY